MSMVVVMVIAIIILAFVMMAGAPVPLAFGGAVVWIIFTMGINPMMVTQVGYASITSYVLLAIPLFIIGGALMSNSRIGSTIVDWFDCFFGRIKGSLTIVSTCAFALFGAVSGSGMAVLSCLGPILYPKMVAKGYPRGVVAAVLCCAAPLGLLIPPSVAQILFAWSANVSVLACFLAIVFPGLLCTVLISIVGLILTRMNASNLTVTEKLSAKLWFKKTSTTTVKSLPGLFMPVIILGGIYSGIMTTTESAAVAAVYALVLSCFIYREVKLRDFNRFIGDAGVTTGVIMIGIFFITVFSRLMLQEGLPQLILKLLLSVSDHTWVILILINIFMIFIGMVMDDVCGILIVSSILTPVVTGIGVSPYQFAAIVGVNLGFGCITPPSAPFLYVTSRITGVPVKEMIKYTLIIILFAYLPVLLITTYIPEFSLWLPKAILGAKFSAF